MVGMKTNGSASTRGEGLIVSGFFAFGSLCTNDFAVFSYA